MTDRADEMSKSMEWSKKNFPGPPQDDAPVGLLDGLTLVDSKNQIFENRYGDRFRFSLENGQKRLTRILDEE